MSEQLSFLPPNPVRPAIKGSERWAECRRRVALACGGHHSQGALFAGRPVMRWICCADCPVRGEVASATEADR